MAKNKYTVVWKPDCEVNTYVTWIELDFNIHQYIDSSFFNFSITSVVNLPTISFTLLSIIIFFYYFNYC